MPAQMHNTSSALGLSIQNAVEIIQIIYVAFSKTQGKSADGWRNPLKRWEFGKRGRALIVQGGSPPFADVHHPGNDSVARITGQAVSLLYRWLMRGLRRDAVASTTAVAECGGGPYSSKMSLLRARVRNGRIVVDEPTTLRDGTVIDLVADDEGDDLTEEERGALHEALTASMESAEAGRLGTANQTSGKTK